MTDRYLDFVNSALGNNLAKQLGLPMPVKLERFDGATQAVINGQVLIGGTAGAGLLDAVCRQLKSMGASASTYAQNPAQAAAKSAGLTLGNYNPETDEGKFKALVFDATGIKDSTELKALYEFFHPVMKKLSSCSRIVVLGRMPEACQSSRQATAQRALEGLIRSTAKEVKKGGTSQLIYVAEGAEDQLESSLRFFLSPKSAYVSAQVVRIHDSASTAQVDWTKPLAGKVTLVTGAARGIGEAIARVLARDGAKVICLDIPQAADDLNKVAASIGGEALPLDITAADAPRQIADYVLNKHSGMDVIVHNAGVTRDKTLGNMAPNLWDMVLNINLSSEERINDELLARSALRDGGRIVCVSSISGIAGNMGQSNYAVSKAGVIGMVQSMAPVLREKHITINAVAPGFIETAMTAAIPFAIREAGRRMNSMSQGGLPVDVAEAIAWYANPASNGVTGNVVRVCGQSLLGA